MKARLLSIFLTLCMLVTVFPTPAGAADTGVSKVVIHSWLRCHDSVELTLTGDEDAAGTWCHAGVSGAFTYDRQIGADGCYTIRLKGGDGDEKTIMHRYSSDKEHIDDKRINITPSVPEGFTMGYEITYDTTQEIYVMTITVREVLTPITDFDPTGTVKSGTGWSWSDDGRTLTIDSAYVLNEETPIHCEELILNGVIEYALMPDLKEVKGRVHNFDGGIALGAGQSYWLHDSARRMTLLTITSDKPFSLGYNGVVFSSDKDNTLRLATSVKELDILSGLEGNRQSKTCLTVENGILKIDGNPFDAYLDDRTIDDSWLKDYTITNAAQLMSLAYMVNTEGESFAGKTITLGADLDLSDVEFTPIGNGGNNQFKGTFNGGGHAITLGALNGDSGYFFGLFGYLGTGAVVKDLTVDGNISFDTAKRSGDAFLFGSIAGVADEDATIINCVSEANLSVNAPYFGGFLAAVYVGGLVGWLDGELLNSAFTGGSISGTFRDDGTTSLYCGSLAASVGNERSTTSVVVNCFTTYDGCLPFGYGPTSECRNVYCPDTVALPGPGLVYPIPKDQITAASGATSSEWTGKKALIDLLNDCTKSIDGAKTWVSGKGGVPTLTLKPSIKLVSGSQTTTLHEGYTDSVTLTFDAFETLHVEYPAALNDYISIEGGTLTIGAGVPAGRYDINAKAEINGSYSKPITVSLTVSAHDYRWVIDREPTYTETGLRHEECSICQAIRSENTIIDKLPCAHDFRWIIDCEPTYTQPGLKHEECSICQAIRNENTVIAKLMDEVTITNAYVVFDTNGGDKMDALTTHAGTTVDLTKYVPTRAGYEFGGWYKDKALSEIVTSIRAAGTTTVYAKWVREKLPFTDVAENSEYYDDISFVYGKGLMIGTSGDKFSPELTLTRGMVTTILWRLSGSPVVNFLMDFTDVNETAYYGEAVRWAQAEKIVNGVGGKRFDPAGEITREQLATIIYRYVQHNGGGFKGMWYFPLNYSDASDISEYADEAMHWCVMNGIIEADENNALRPAAPATRAETAHAYHILAAVNK